MTWNLQSYATTVLNERICDILGGQNILWPSCIFSEGLELPKPPSYLRPCLAATLKERYQLMPPAAAVFALSSASEWSRRRRARRSWGGWTWCGWWDCTVQLFRWTPPSTRTASVKLRHIHEHFFHENSSRRIIWRSLGHGRNTTVLN